ncbi:MAG: flagellar biosynthetic protein FliR [Anaerofustis sp.]
MSLSYNFTVLLLIIMRLSGCILLNPIFGRKSIPVIYRIGLVLFISYFVYKAIPMQTIQISTLPTLMIALVKEFVMGYFFGFIIQLFVSVVMIAGEVIDMQMGVSMSKVYDPQSNVSMAMSASFLNIMFMLIFFAINGHLTLIRIFIFSFGVIPLGDMTFQPELFRQMAGMLTYILIYAVKLAMPILAAELITEIGVGIIMKAVPQINVFVVNLQLKVLLGFVVMLVLAPPFASFLERIILLMYDKMDLVFQYIT